MGFKAPKDLEVKAFESNEPKGFQKLYDEELQKESRAGLGSKAGFQDLGAQNIQKDVQQ